MKISVSLAPCGIATLFDAVAKAMGIKPTINTQYDCRKINVAPNIQDNFYEFYSSNAKVINPTTSETDIRVGITMLLAMSGPKVDTALKANEVEVFDGFIC